jgi:diguanylate cyclase (GGDEF)-like protein
VSFVREDELEMKKFNETIENVQKTEVRKKIISALKEKRDSFIDIVQILNEEIGNQIYSDVFNIIANLDFTPEKSRKEWEKILKHMDIISEALGRRVDFRVALLDFLLSKNRIIEIPKIVELLHYEKTAQYALIDELTGIFNRRYFLIAMERELKRACRYKYIVSVLFFDIDDFKSFNDKYGHETGDQILSSVGEILCSLTRGEDIVARYGGEEFVVVLPQTDKFGGHTFATRVQDRLRGVEIVEDCKITISGGIASYPEDGLEVKDVINQADKAMYKAKYGGKNRIIYESPV